MLAQSHPYLGRLPNNSPLLAAALVYLDLNNSSSSNNNSNNNRIPKANKALLGHLVTNRRLGRRAQPNPNRVDVSCLVIYGLLLWHHLLTRNSIWYYSDSTARYGSVWWHGRWSIRKYAATGCSAARRPTIHIRSVQDNNTHIRGWRALW